MGMLFRLRLELLPKLSFEFCWGAVAYTKFEKLSGEICGYVQELLNEVLTVDFNFTPKEIYLNFMFFKQFYD